MRRSCHRPLHVVNPMILRILKRYAFTAFRSTATNLLAKPLTVGLYVHQLHVNTEGETHLVDKVACEVACTLLLTQARNIQVMPLPLPACVLANRVHWKWRI